MNTNKPFEEIDAVALGERPNAPSIDVELSNTQHQMSIAAKDVQGLVQLTLNAEGFDRGTISIAVVDDASIRLINRRHLNHDWPTDVITFPLSDPEDNVIAGELVASGEMAATTAREAGVDAWHELALYLVHGLLHLCGYKDSTTEEIERMRRREAEILALAGVPNTFRAANLAPAAGSDLENGLPESVRWTA